MALEPFLGEITPYAFNFPPRGWAICSGQLLPINQNQALFSLLGTTYGGNGTTNFALPDLRGKVAIGVSQTHPLGEPGGSATQTLTTGQIPGHNHGVSVASAGTTNSPVGAIPGPTGGHALYDPAINTTLAADVITPTGGSQPHENMQPTLCINYCIALQGIFPSRN